MMCYVNRQLEMMTHKLSSHFSGCPSFCLSVRLSVPQPKTSTFVHILSTDYANAFKR